MENKEQYKIIWENGKFDIFDKKLLMLLKLNGRKIKIEKIDNEN